MGYAGITDIEKYKDYVLQDGDILMSHINSEIHLGKSALYRKQGEEVIIHGMNLLCLRPNYELLDSAFVNYYFNSNAFIYQIPNITKKSVNQASFSVSALKKLNIPTPSLETQRKIAANLDKVTHTIDLCNAILEKLDLLVKSRFVEMFGDTYSNPMNWNRMSFRQVSKRLSDGPFGSNLKSEHYSDSGVRVIRLGNIGIGEFIDKDKSFIQIEHYEKLKKYTCRTGDIVIGTLGEPNLRACRIPDYIDIAINKADCVHFIPNDEILNVTFACHYINCPETLALASSMVHGQTRTRISSGQIAELPIYLPPIDLQQQFAAFVEQTDKSKLAVKQVLEKAETLKKALMQEYFG